jgi:hypothetical protein
VNAAGHVRREVARRADRAGDDVFFAHTSTIGTVGT